jgi:hypothetical protein
MNNTPPDKVPDKLDEKSDEKSDEKPDNKIVIDYQKTFADCDIFTQCKWAFKYFIVGAFTAIVVIRLVWLADWVLPTEMVFFIQAYLLVGILICEWDKQHAVKLDGQWNIGGWARQVYWWCWWPYFAWKAVLKRF